MRQKYYFVFDFIILYILIFKFLNSKLEDKIFCTCPDFCLLLISSWIQFWFVKVVPKYLNSSKATMSVFVLWLHPAFWYWDMSMYLDLSAFSCLPALCRTFHSNTFLIAVLDSWGCPDECSNIQDLHLILIISLLEVYEKLMHCFILFPFFC